MVLICAGVSPGLADFNNAAIAPACGAAAEVPKNVLNPPMLVETPSAAVMSGLFRTMPPFVPNKKLPGVTGVPSGFRKIRRGPSELNLSALLDPTNGCGKGPVGEELSAQSRPSGLPKDPVGPRAAVRVRSADVGLTDSSCEIFSQAPDQIHAHFHLCFNLGIFVASSSRVRNTSDGVPLSKYRDAQVILLLARSASKSLTEASAVQ